MLVKLIKFFVLLVLLYPSISIAEEAIDNKSEKDTVQEKSTEMDKIMEEVVDSEKAAGETIEEKKENIEESLKKAEEKVEEVEKEKAEPVRTKISALINSGGELKVEGIALNKKLLGEIYAAHHYKTIWFDGIEPNKNYKKALEFISLADENGLARKDFNHELITKRVEKDDRDEKFTARTDVLITNMVAMLIKRVGNGYAIPKELKLQTYFTRPVRVTNAAAAFEEFLDSDDNEELLLKYSPKHPQYLLLREALKKAIEAAGDKRVITPIPYIKDLVPGDKNYTISQIRDKIGLRRPIDPKFDADVYDKTLAVKIRELQEKFGLLDNGVINKEFIDTLNNHDIDSISMLKTNMERYRWLPDDMDKVRLEVNLASFKIHAYDDGKEAFSMNVIAGKEAHKTPIMSTKMYQFVLNPYWNVPKAYFLRNMVALLRDDPNYVKNQNFDLMRLEKDGWKIIEQSSVDWNTVNADNYNYLLRQRPGNLNVLGPIKFAINNPYDIYLHSTSEPWLFTNKYRGYSSGCIRVEDPVKFANFLIDKGDVDIKEEQFLKLYNAYYSKEGNILPQKKEYNDKYFKFKTPIAIYTTYFSAIADEDGSVDFLDDTYGLDLEHSRALGL